MENTKIVHKYPRSSGVLLPVSMLHGPFGIGVLGTEAMEFIDFLHDAGFHAWQVLPIEHTGVSYSPYKCISAFAGEPMLVDPRPLCQMGLITEEELEERALGTCDDHVNYGLVRDKHRMLLRIAYSRLARSEDGTIIDGPHCSFNPPWFDTYGLYKVIKHSFGETPWYEWPDEKLRAYDEDAIKKAKEDLSGEIDFYRFVQWQFHEQWRKVKDYAALREISIIGDMPFYVSEDSVEAWSSRNLFDTDKEGNFLTVAGAPPDYFSPKGQHWGNPIYNWKLMKKNNYDWWVRRVQAALARYDYVRLDHFRGFESYWSIPADAPDATSGKWVVGPGMALFNAIESALGSKDIPLIAEDLGDTHGNVDKLLKDTGFRGMRVLQFGFLGDEKHLPHCITEDCVAYTGTHDNTTLLAWLYELSAEDREHALFYTGFKGDWSAGGPHSAGMKAWARALFATAASLAILPIQDMLGYGVDTRTNTPGTKEGNWRFRIRGNALREIDAGFYRSLNKVTFRDNAI